MALFEDLCKICCECDCFNLVKCCDGGAECCLDCCKDGRRCCNDCFSCCNENACSCLTNSSCCCSSCTSCTSGNPCYNNCCCFYCGPESNRSSFVNHHRHHNHHSHFRNTYNNYYVYDQSSCFYLWHWGEPTYVDSADYSRYSYYSTPGSSYHNTSTYFAQRYPFDAARFQQPLCCPNTFNDICLRSCFCPCIQFALNSKVTRHEIPSSCNCLCYCLLCLPSPLRVFLGCIGGPARTDLRHYFGLENDLTCGLPLCEDVCFHTCCSSLALCQEAHEIRIRSAQYNQTPSFSPSFANSSFSGHKTIYAGDTAPLSSSPPPSFAPLPTYSSSSNSSPLALQRYDPSPNMTRHTQQVHCVQFDPSPSSSSAAPPPYVPIAYPNAQTML